MMRHAGLPKLTLAFVVILRLSARAQKQSVASRSSIEVGAEFSHNSNHLLIGNAYNRKLAGLDLTYSFLLRQNRTFQWNYDVELRPVTWIQDPVSTTTETIQFGTQPPYGPFPVQDGPIQKRCSSAIATVPGNQPGVTVRENRVCGTRWTYSGGLSPLGQRFTFLPRRPMQPYVLFNAGFLVATRDIPSNNSSVFNFTFAFGGGLAFPTTKGRAISVDYRIHHLSNRAIGDTNPGVDNQVMRLSYVFGAKHS